MSSIQKFQISAIPNKLVEIVNGINQQFFVTLVLVLFFFRFELNWNEEHYMVLAKQFYDPDWVSGSFTFTEFASTRVLFQYIVGFLLHYLPFEIVLAIVRLLLSVLIAYPVTKVYRLFGVSNIFILLQLPILFFFQGVKLYLSDSNQSFLGGEWIFVGVEPKVFAYIFVFFALYYLLVERFSLMVIFLAIASYFHILVGGWVMFYFSLYHLIAKRSFKAPFLNGLLYIVCLLPLLFYLWPVLGHSISTSEASEKADWIFAYFKQPFHTGIFLTMKYFIRGAFHGLMYSFFFFLLCVFLFNQYKDKYNLRINLLNKIIFIGTLVSVILAYFDKSGAFGKYFPFRINSIYCFMVFLQLAIFLQHSAFKNEMVKYAQFSILIWFVFITAPVHLFHLFQSPYSYFTGKSKDPAYDEVCEYIKQNTPKDSKLLFLPQSATPEYYYDLDGNMNMVNMVRKTERDRFVLFFAAPISPDVNKTIEWYRRIQLKKSIVEGSQDLCDAVEGEKVDFLLSDFKRDTSLCYSLLYNNESYFLYKINRR